VYKLPDDVLLEIFDLYVVSVLAPPRQVNRWDGTGVDGRNTVNTSCTV